VTRNLIKPETAEHNRERPGAWTFNAEIADDYDGLCFVVAALRLGEHAHLDCYSGHQVAKVEGALRPTRHLGKAGKLILRWDEWLLLRDILDGPHPVLVREVENPSQGNLDIHVGGER